MKRIVVCLDGTWNNDDSQTTDTNVAQMARAIHGSQETGGILQVVLYLRGVGTTGLKIDTLVQGAIGLGVDDNIRSAYQFIAQNYLPGDEIYLFGFSRGSFTARSLVGLITACSILKRQALASLPDAWAYYRTDKPHSPDDFARRYKVDVHTGRDNQVCRRVGNCRAASASPAASRQPCRRASTRSTIRPPQRLF